jgi:enoyl-CoA hydratase/carnithine racemase
MNGIVAGSGNEFNLSFNPAIAADHVTIRQIGNTRGSVAAREATQWLPLLVGERRARAIIWLNEEISAKQAPEWGLINQLVPMEHSDTAVDDWVDKLLLKKPDVMRYTKAHTNFRKEFAWSRTVMHARDWLAIHADSAEAEEGRISTIAAVAVKYYEFWI